MDTATPTASQKRIAAHCLIHMTHVMRLQGDAKGLQGDAAKRVHAVMFDVCAPDDEELETLQVVGRAHFLREMDIWQRIALMREYMAIDVSGRDTLDSIARRECPAFYSSM